MLTQETIKRFSSLLGFTAEELAKAITDEAERDLTPKTIKAFTQESWDALEDSIDAEKADKYNIGKGVGAEQAIKNIKKQARESGLEFEGKKPEDFISNFKAAVLKEADKNPDNRVAELEKDLKIMREETLFAKDQKINELSGIIQTNKVRSTLTKHLPSKLPGGLDQEDALLIVTSKLNFGYDEEGNEIVKQGDKVLKDSTRSPIGFKDAISDFATQKNWRVNESGGTKGTDDDTGGGAIIDHKGIRKSSDLNKYYEKNEIHPLSQKARIIQSEATKAALEAKEEFVFDE